MGFVLQHEIGLLPFNLAIAAFSTRFWYCAMTTGTDNAYRLAKKYKIKTAFGTDVLFDAGLAAKQGKQLAKLKLWYTPYEALKMATHDNALRGGFQPGERWGSTEPLGRTTTLSP